MDEFLKQLCIYRTKTGEPPGVCKTLSGYLCVCVCVVDCLDQTHSVCCVFSSADELQQHIGLSQEEEVRGQEVAEAPLVCRGSGAMWPPSCSGLFTNSQLMAELII